MHRDDPHTPPPRAVAAARPAPTEPTGALRLALLVSLLLLLLVLACSFSMFGTTSRDPYVACPLPEPLPWGWDGPRKPGCTCPDGTTECPACWYDLWEQEGGEPEPERHERAFFAFDEPVTIEPFTVRVKVGYDWQPGTPDDQHLALVRLWWGNPTTAPLTATDDLTATMLLTPTLAPAGPVSITYESALRITAVAGDDGTHHSGVWTVTDEALALKDLTLPDTIPAGNQRHIIPILIPQGRVEELTLALRYLGEEDGGEDEVRVRFADGMTPVSCLE